VDTYLQEEISKLQYLLFMLFESEVWPDPKLSLSPNFITLFIGLLNKNGSTGNSDTHVKFWLTLKDTRKPINHVSDNFSPDFCSINAMKTPKISKKISKKFPLSAAHGS
jgi:hypothetical protein